MIVGRKATAMAAVAGVLGVASAGSTPARADHFRVSYSSCRPAGHAQYYAPAPVVTYVSPAPRIYAPVVRYVAPAPRPVVYRRPVYVRPTVHVHRPAYWHGHRGGHFYGHGGHRAGGFSIRIRR